MAGEKKRLLENFLSLGALQIISYVIPLITLPYLSRVLGTENFGLVFFAFAFMQYFIMLTDYGFGLSATREIAVNRHNQNNLSNIFNSVITAKFILLLISFVLLLIAICFIPKLKANYIVFFLSFIMVIGNFLYPVWFFQGMERMKYITLLNILSKTIFLVLIFVFVKKDSDYIIVPLLNSLGFLVSGIIGFWFAVKNFNIKLYIPKLVSIKKQFINSSNFFFASASVTLYTSTNTFCLGLIGSNVMVGYYVAAEKIYNALIGLHLPLNKAIYPYVAKYKDVNLFKKLFYVSTAVNFCVCIFAWIFAKQIITVFYGADMIYAYKILRIFIIIAAYGVMTILIGYPFLGGLGYTKDVTDSVIISSLFHVLGLGFLFITHKMNVFSIAYLVLCTEMLVLLLRLYSIKKYNLWRVNK